MLHAAGTINIIREALVCLRAQLIDTCEPGSFLGVVLEWPHLFPTITLRRQTWFFAITKRPLASKASKHGPVHTQVSLQYILAYFHW